MAASNRSGEKGGQFCLEAQNWEGEGGREEMPERLEDCTKERRKLLEGLVWARRFEGQLRNLVQKWGMHLACTQQIWVPYLACS